MIRTRGHIVLVTGASGFIGRALCMELDKRKYIVRCGVRDISSFNDARYELAKVEDIGPLTDWSSALHRVDTVVHLAARVHMMQSDAADPLATFLKINKSGTLNLAGQAAGIGVKRFVFLSTIKVNGQNSQIGKPFCVDDTPSPQDPYGISKLAAEQGLKKIAAKADMKVVIIRPPLVYGPGVRANFLKMMKWLYRGIPLPFGAIYNKRSLIALNNLVDLIITCLDHPAAANQVFLAGDGEDLSTTEILQRVGLALGRPARLIPVPALALEVGAILMGRRDIAQQLCGSLQVDISKARILLGWNPPISVEEGLSLTAQDYLNEKGT